MYKQGTTNSASLGLSEPSGGQIAVFTIVGFALGIVTVWLYAAIRPRFGPGIRTAIVTGVVIWLLIYPLPSIGYAVLDMFPDDFLLIANIWMKITSVQYNHSSK